MLKLADITPEWTLFLDRDGVINYEKKNDYIRNKDEFRFYEGTPAVIASLSKQFKHLIIVTNQKGIGKGLMSENDLQSIHTHMLEAIEAAGGRIDGIYFCKDLADDSPNRKPQAGMAFQAKQDFPDIEFSKSIMVGNRLSDMAFGRNAGIHTLFVATTHPEIAFPHPDIDLRYPNLGAFANALAAIR